MNSDKSYSNADLTLIDGYGYVFRAFYALPSMHRKDGTPVNAVYGFTRMLASLLREKNIARCLVVFDAKGKSFRSKIFNEYKANRRETPSELIAQFAIVREAAQAFSLPIIEHVGFEADDLIASYTREARIKGWRTEIYSSDKDLMQLITNKIWLRDPVKNRVINKETVLERFGVTPDKIKDVMALAGDASDNIPGVPGIGIKIAAELITRFGDLETLLASTEKITQMKRRQTLQNNVEKARMSMRLVTLAENAPCTIAIDSLTKPQPERKRLSKFLHEQNFLSLLQELEARSDDSSNRRLSELFIQKDEKNNESRANTHATASYKNRGSISKRVIVFEAEDEIVATSQPKHKYSVITDEERLADFCLKARKHGLCSLAIEATSASIINAEIVAIALSIDELPAVYIPLAHKTEDGSPLPSQIPRSKVFLHLKQLFEDRSTLKVGYNLKQVIAILQKHSIGFLSYDDIILLSATLDGGKYGSNAHALPALALRHLQHKVIEYSGVVGTGNKTLNFERAAIDLAGSYLTDVASVTLRLQKLFADRLITECAKGIYETLERPLIPVIIDMERQGVRIDSQALKKLSENFLQQINLLAKEIHKLAGEEFAIASPKQLGEILFSRMQLSGAKKTASGQFSTKSTVLDKLAEEGHIIATRVLDWRRLSKLRSTYAEALPLQVHPQTQRVHTSFSLSGAQTGRLASSDPNLQNIPIRDQEGRQIRRAFIATEGYRLISLDYSQIELRLIAAIASVEPMLDSFAQGLDIHSATAAEMFSVQINKVSKEQRRYAKTVNFSLLYGISKFSLARRLGINENDAQDMISLYFARYPQLRRYREKTINFCRDNHYVETLFGRKIYLPAINDHNHHVRAHAERQAINAPVQGSAADIVKQSMLRLHRAFTAKTHDNVPEEGEYARVYMLLQVHDEIVIEAPLSIAENTACLAQQIMSKASEPQQYLPIPLEVTYNISDNWLAA